MSFFWRGVGFAIPIRIVKVRFPRVIIGGMADPSRAQRLYQRMTELGLRLATAESCTGGLIGHKITNVPGSSNYYQGGVVSYSNDAKVWLLGVRPETLDRFGAVSRETMLEMAQGARSALEADVGLSVSGIAGPDGGTAEKPVGLVWVGLSLEGMELAQSFQFEGDRGAIKEQAAEGALGFLLDHLALLDLG